MTWNKENVLAIDIGNSRIKLLDDCFYFAFDLMDNDWQDNVRRVLTKQGGLPQKVVVSSVNRAAQRKLTEIFESLETSYLNADALLASSRLVDFSKVDGMGNDRKLGLIGAMGDYPTPLVVVDCGTAITINFLISPNIAIGGAIFPGLLTQAKALNHYTSLLPQVDIELPKSFCGADTDQAIKAGIFGSVMGGIKEVITRNTINRFKRVKPKVIITGGDAAILAHNISGFDISVETNLVLKGIQKLAKN